MGMSRRLFTKEFKLSAVSGWRRGIHRRGSAGVGGQPERVASLAARVPAWAGNAFPGKGQCRWSEGRIVELERKIGRQALEIDFLQGCLQRIEEKRMLQALNGNPRSTTVSTPAVATPSCWQPIRS